MNNNLKNKQGGFLELIVVLIITFLIMKYYGITFTGIFNWVRDLFLSVW